MVKLSLRSLFIKVLISVFVAAGLVTASAPAQAANGQAVVTRSNLQTSERKNTQELEVQIGNITGPLLDVTLVFTGLSLADTNPANTVSSAFYSGTSSYATCPNSIISVMATNSISGKCRVQNSGDSKFFWQGSPGYQTTGGQFLMRFPAGSLTFGSSTTPSLNVLVDNVSVGFFNLTETPLAQQASLSVTSTSGTFGNPLTLTSSGGSGGGALTYTTTNGTASGCTVTGNSLSSSSAGTCQVTASKAADSTYAAISSSSTTVSIGLVSRTLGFGSTTTYTLAYGATRTVTATPSLGAGDGAVTYSVSAGNACTVNASTGEIRVTGSTGSCEVSASIAQGTNYLAASTTTQVVVNGTVKAITITGGSPSVSFGNSFTPSALDISNTAGALNQLLDYTAATFTYTGVNGTLYPSTTTAPTHAGTYSVLPSNVLIETGSNVDTTANYNISYAPGLLTISKVSRNLAFTATSYSLSFGDNQTVVANADAGDGIVTYSAGSSTACTVNSATGLVTVTDSSGSCSITATIAAGTNHLAAATTTPVTVTVSARPITLTASSPAATVGETVSPSFSMSTGTLVGSDAISGVTYRYEGTGSTTFTSSTTAPTSIGTYSITPSAPVFSTGSGTNYSITFGVGTLTINNKLSRTLSFTSSTSFTLEYGQSQSVTAAVSGGPFDGTITFSDGSSTACSVGTSTGIIEVTSSTGTCVVSAEISEGVQYLGAITTTPVTVTVVPRALTLTAKNKTVSYGSAITPEFEITQGLLQNSDSLSGVSYTFAGTGSTSFASSATTPTAGGTYSITPWGAVFSAGLAANYSITYVTASLTIGQDAVPSATMTLDSPVGTRILGGTLTYSASGMQPSARYEVTLRSTPQILSSGVTAGGSVNGTTNMPRNLEAGWHTLTFVSTASDGSTFTESMYIKVSASGMLLATSTALPADLAHTGADLNSMTLVATAMLMLGLAIVRMASRKTHKRRG